MNGRFAQLAFVTARARLPMSLALILALALSLAGSEVELPSSLPSNKPQDSDSTHTHHKPKDATPKPSGPEAPKGGPGHQRMLQVLHEISVRSAEEHPYMGEARVRSLSSQLANLEASSSEVTIPEYWGDLKRWQVLLELGTTELRLGREEAGIEHLLAAYRLLPKIQPYIQKSKVNKTIFQLGIGYMRLGETQILMKPPSAQVIQIVEGKEGYTKLPLKRFTF